MPIMGPGWEESDAVMALNMQPGKQCWLKGLAPEQMGGQDLYKKSATPIRRLR